MSARQRSRLANQASLLSSKEAAASESEQESEEEGEISKHIHAKNAFTSYYSSSSEQESASEAESKSDIDTTDKPNKTTPVSFVQVKEEEQVPAIDELQYLDSIIEEYTIIGQNSARPANTQIADIYSTLLRIEDKSLDVTAVRRRGEDMLFMERDQPGAQRRGNNRIRGINPRHNPHNNAHNPQQGNMAGFNHRIGSRRYVFGAPSDDWLRPPAFVSGGIGMSKTRYPAVRSNKHSTHHNAHERHRGNKSASSGSIGVCEYYTYEWSPEFTFLQQQYQYIESTGDANLLVMFLTHFQYHPHGLLQLALVYARMQQTDKAAELVRRALYVMECAALESFKMQDKNYDKLRLVRMDPYAAENGIYFAVLYRHMELCSAQGHHAIAADVCRYLLSLHPVDDAQHLLLTLDYYLLKAERHDMLLAYCGLTQQRVCDVVTNSVDMAVFSFVFDSPYKFDLLEDVPMDTPVSAVAGSAVGSEGAGSGELCSRSLQHLPNWWFSLALSQYMVEQSARGPTSGTTKLSVSTVLLQAALYRWPFMLAPLLNKMGVDLKGFPVLRHAWFMQTEKRLPADGYLQQISRVYSGRNSSLWSLAPVQQWLSQACSELLVMFNTAPAVVDVLNYAALHDTANQHNRVLASYADASPDEYEVFPHFPGGASPIDATLDDPVYMLSGAVKFRDFMDSEGRFMFAVPPPYVSTVKSADNYGAGYASSEGEGNSGDEQVRNMRHVRNLLQYGMHFGDADAHTHTQTSDARVSNIDFGLPLMQLFLATLLPWIFVRPLHGR